MPDGSECGVEACTELKVGGFVPLSTADWPGRLVAVVFCQGCPWRCGYCHNPHLQRARGEAMLEVRGMGFGVGLHTAGMYPRRLRRLLPLTDWVGFDVKTLFSDYKAVAGVAGGARALESVHATLESGVDCEFRTTVHPDLIEARTLRILAATLARLGVKRYVLQEFRAQGCPDSRLRAPRSVGYLDEHLCLDLARLFESFEIRRA